MRRNNRSDVRSDEKWTRDEMRVHKNGMSALAAAVIKQWQLDGKPEADRQAIEAWRRVIDVAEQK